VSKLKLAGGIALGLAIALLGGWIWGASGRSELVRRLETADLRLALADARARLLQSRVDIYNVNFGEASQNLEAARAPLQKAIAGLERAGQTELAGSANQALTRLDEAQRQAGALDQGANTTAGAAATALEEIGARLP
jgi:hypothetical protein